MGALARGSVVLVPFPFSDLSRSKLRPAVVLAAVGRDDFVLCQVTSNPYGDPYSVQLTGAEFGVGSLRLTSYARPGKLFTASEQIVRHEVGSLTAIALDRIAEIASGLIRGTA